MKTRENKRLQVVLATVILLATSCWSDVWAQEPPPGAYVAYTASTSGSPRNKMVGDSGCKDSYRMCTEECLPESAPGQCQVAPLRQTEDAGASGEQQSWGFTAARTVIHCMGVPFSTNMLQTLAAVRCLIGIVETTTILVRNWEADAACPDFAPTTEPGEKLIAKHKHGHHSYEDVAAKTCTACRCEVGCTQRFSNINWSTDITGVHEEVMTGVKELTWNAGSFGRPSMITTCEPRIHSVESDKLNTSRLVDTYFEDVCESYCQATKEEACVEAVMLNNTAPRGDAWGWCENKSTTDAKTIERADTKQVTHTQCLVEDDLAPNGNWGCGLEGDPWGWVSEDGVVYDCTQNAHKLYQCDGGNQTADGSGMEDNLAEPEHCKFYACDGTDDCADGTTVCGDCALECGCIEVCDDEQDNDRDGNTDCADDECESDPHCDESLQCDDGVDNDLDGDTDCEDDDCSSESLCMEAGQCSDGVDNDVDMLIDCADPDCAMDPACFETDCDDGVDNDGDLDVDCADTDCLFDPVCTLTDMGIGSDAGADMGNVDAGLDMDAGSSSDLGTPDSGTGVDTGSGSDMGMSDSGTGVDTGSGSDMGMSDSGSGTDAGSGPDVGISDSGSGTDTGSGSDMGMSDSSSGTDTGLGRDMGLGSDMRMPDTGMGPDVGSRTDT